MLNVEKFYKNYGLEVAPDSHMALHGCHIIAYPTQLFIMCVEYNGDPFKWLALPLDGIIFYSRSNYLSIVLLFDEEDDETEKSIQQCNYLIRQG